jgi:hypothetical protein
VGGAVAELRILIPFCKPARLEKIVTVEKERVLVKGFYEPSVPMGTAFHSFSGMPTGPFKLDVQLLPNVSGRARITCSEGGLAVRFDYKPPRSKPVTLSTVAGSLTIASGDGKAADGEHSETPMDDSGDPTGTETPKIAEGDGQNGEESGGAAEEQTDNAAEDQTDKAAEDQTDKAAEDQTHKAAEGLSDNAAEQQIGTTSSHSAEPTSPQKLTAGAPAQQPAPALNLSPGKIASLLRAYIPVRFRIEPDSNRCPIFAGRCVGVAPESDIQF